MTKQEWVKLYEILDNIYSDFVMQYPNIKDGKNKTIRDAAQRKAESLIHLAEHHIYKNTDILDLLMGEATEENSYARAIKQDEFNKPRYFYRDFE